jgi:Bacterial Ig domain
MGRFAGAVVHAIVLLGLFGSTPQAWAGGTNSCPTALPLSISVAGGGTVNFQLMATDPDGDALQFVVTSPPAHGVVVLQVGTGAGTYTPAPGYCGPDSFRFRVSDGQCQSNDATVSITVCPPPTSTATGTSTATATRTATGTATGTSTATPTATPVPEGGACMETAQCEPPLSCIDEVCTRPPAAVPALTSMALIVAVMLLAAIAAVGVWRRR